MAVVFNIVLHVLLIGSMVLFANALFVTVFDTDIQLERAIRAAALFCGAMVVIGAQGAGISYADFIVKSLGDVKPFSAGILAGVVPGLAGVGLAWYFVRAIKRSETLAIRVLGFIGMLSLVQFAEVYAIATQNKGIKLGATAVPNIAFLVGLILYVVFKMDPETTQALNRGLFGHLGKPRNAKPGGLLPGRRRQRETPPPTGRDRLR